MSFLISRNSIAIGLSGIASLNGANPSSWPLNLISTQAAAAYSLRKLKNTYTGSTIRVRRSLDNAEADIGFTPSGDLNTTALQSFVGSQNLLQHSEAFDNAYWGKSASSVTATNIASPIGTSDAELINFLSGGAVTANLTGWTAGTIATVSVWVKRASSGSASHFYITTNNTLTWNTGQSTKVLLTNEWQRVSLSGNLVTSGTSLGVRFGARDIGGNVDPDCVGNVEMWGAQLNLGNLQPYSPTTRRNLLTFTEAFDNPAWAKSNSTVTPNTIVAPGGDVTADTITTNSTSSPATGLYATVASTISNSTLSCFIKKGDVRYIAIGLWNTTGAAECGAGFDLDTGSVTGQGAIGAGYSATNATITPVGNDWYRCSVTITSPAGTNYPAILHRTTAYTSGAITGSVPAVSTFTYFWGAQLEASSTATAYQLVNAAWTSTRDGNGFVTTWYDQSGNARNATQATAANQPMVVSAGVVVTQNNKPALSFDGSNDVLSGAIPLLNEHSINLVTTSLASGSDLGFLNYSTNTVSQAITHHNGTNLYCYFGSGATAVVRSLALNTPAVITRTWDGTANISNANLYIQGVAGTTKIGTPSSADATTTLTIGRAANFATQRMQELIISQSALSTADRQTLESNQGSYYNITVS